MRALVLSWLRVAIVIAGYSVHNRTVREYVYTVFAACGEGFRGGHSTDTTADDAIAVVVVVVVVETPALATQLGRAACSHLAHAIEHTGRPAEVWKYASENIVRGNTPRCFV